MQTGTASTAITASYRGIDKKNATRESESTNPAKTGKDTPFGPKCMCRTKAMTKVRVNKRGTSWFFPREFDAPHTNSKHHSTTYYKPVHNFNRNLK
jgi:hypothetical protein